MKAPPSTVRLVHLQFQKARQLLFLRLMPAPREQKQQPRPTLEQLRTVRGRQSPPERLGH